VNKEVPFLLHRRDLIPEGPNRTRPNVRAKVDATVLRHDCEQAAAKFVERRTDGQEEVRDSSSKLLVVYQTMQYGLED
jgi:hypothetical protein